MKREKKYLRNKVIKRNERKLKHAKSKQEEYK